MDQDMGSVADAGAAHQVVNVCRLVDVPACKGEVSSSALQAFVTARHKAPCLTGAAAAPQLTHEVDDLAREGALRVGNVWLVSWLVIMEI